MRKNLFQRIPFIRIFSLFIAGILFTYFLSPNIYYVSAILFLIIAFLLGTWRNTSFNLIKFENFFCAAALFLTGSLYFALISTNDLPTFSKKSFFQAEICQKPAEKVKTFQTLAILKSPDLKFPEKVTVFFDKKDFDSTISTGDVLEIYAKPQKIKNAGNPFEFNYELMMDQRNIHFSVFLKKADYNKTSERVLNWGNWAERTRDYLVKMLTQAIASKEERSVISALTLGYRTELDQDTLDYFASTGAMHVLSVSGLHVALIYMIMGYLLFFLKRGKSGSYIFPGIMVLFLWLYAFISGFSPPVQRATIMFTFVIIGNSLRRPVNVFNSLTASAMLLILLNPYVIFDVGFQLSYLAILGIVLLQPGLDNILTLKNKILKSIWSLFTVGIAAQLATFPLGIYYFNQFPNLFWLSNLIVVPVTTLIMWTSIGFFVLIPLKSISGFLGLITEKLTTFMLWALKAIDAHPLAVTKGLILNIGQVILIYLLISTILFFLFSKRKTWFFMSLIIIVVFEISSLVEKNKLLNQRFILVYNTKNTTIHIVNGRKNYLLTRAEMTESEQHTVQKVVDHYMLDTPIIINREKDPKFSSSDLSYTDGTLRLTDCLIKIKANKTGKQPTSDDIVIRVLPTAKNQNPNEIHVTTGYKSQFFKEIHSAPVCTKTDGAFLLSLDNK